MEADSQFLKSLKKKKKNIFASCYPLSENLHYMYKSYFGPSNRYANRLKPIANNYMLNEGVKPKYRIGILGDIMDFKGKTVSISEEVYSYLEDCDVILGNFEGTITNKIGLFKSQTISEHALDVLTNLPGKRKIFSISNNHAGDFGWDEFKHTLKMFKDKRIEIFGLDSSPTYEVFDDLRFLTGTIWSNLKCDYISYLSKLDYTNQDHVFNLLYPHWGYEFELYPRPSIINHARKLLTSCDCIFGTHPHTIQPITMEFSDNRNKIVSYSVGNFITGQSKEMKQHGLIVKVDIGPNQNNIMMAGKIQWAKTKCNLTDTEINIKLNESIGT